MAALIRRIVRRFKGEKGVEEEKPQIELQTCSSSFDEHHLFLQQIAQRYPTSKIDIARINASSGLNQAEAAELLVKNGPNRLTQAKQTSAFMLFFRQIKNPFYLLLFTSGILSIVVYLFDTTQPVNLYLGVAIIFAAIMYCLMSFWEEKRSLKVIRGFSHLLPEKCIARRDGTDHEIFAENLVVGDLVWVRNGDKVPADLRLIYVNDMKLETAALTGESEPIDYTTEAAAAHVALFDAHNVAFNGSLCLDGEGFGVVIRIADETVIGQIAKITSSQKESKTMLEVEVGAFVRFLAILSITMATIVFIIGLIMNGGRNILYTFVNGFIVVVLANYPLGLPGTLTSQLTIIARQMAHKNVFLKRLEIVETFGAATVIASDKTGTLTKNDMTVCDLWYDSRYTAGMPDIRKRTIAKMSRQDSITSSFSSFTTLFDLMDKPLQILFRAMCLCNKAKIEKVDEAYQIDASLPVMTPDVESGAAELKRPTPVQSSFSVEDAIRKYSKHQSQYQSRVRITGNPSEAALLRYIERMTSTEFLRKQNETVFEIPFNSLRKWHLVIVRDPAANVDANGNITYMVIMKGAPEVIIRKCSFYESEEEGQKPITEDYKYDFEDAYLHFGREGRRVIGFCYLEFTAPENIQFDAEKENYPMNNLCFIGMAAIMDPPREDTAPAIAACKQAGIKVFMVTGDHPITAAAIARQIGLIGSMDRIERGPLRQNSILVQEGISEADESSVIHGEQLSRFSEAQWDELLKRKYLVFARTTPEQKLTIVEQCQKRKEVVAVTGDGVNDAPALKRANIGVAMGKNGSQVAKEAADIVLMDDRFSSIVIGIEQGRLLFENLKKTIAYTLPHLWPEIGVVLLNLVLGFPLPMTALQIIAVDLGTEMAPTISMAYEPSEQDIMKKPPRKPGHKLVTKSLLIYAYVTAGGIMTIGCFIAYCWVFWQHGINIKDLPFTATNRWQYVTSETNLTDSNLFFTSNNITFGPVEQEIIQREAAAAWHITMVMSQAYHLWACKTRRVSLFQHGCKNLMSIFAVIIEVSLIVIFNYVPGLQRIMGSGPPWGFSWVPSIGVGIILFAYGEGRKWYIRRSPTTRLAKFLYW